jgi:hypothetical protein
MKNTSFSVICIALRMGQSRTGDGAMGRFLSKSTQKQCSRESLQ